MMGRVSSLVLCVCVVACGGDRLRAVPRAPLEPSGTPADVLEPAPADEPSDEPLPSPDEPKTDVVEVEPDEPDEPAPTYQAQVYVDCVNTPGEQGADLYWIDSNGQPSALVEDCGYYGTTLNCAGANMQHHGDEGEAAQANAAALGLNPDAFLGCCGPNASTIDRYGCLPYSEAGEPCFYEHRYYNKCVSGLECRRASVDAPYLCQ
jgi:hypothetical protein